MVTRNKIERTKDLLYVIQEKIQRGDDYEEPLVKLMSLWGIEQEE
jgi:hypothetical protein